MVRKPIIYIGIFLLLVGFVSAELAASGLHVLEQGIEVDYVSLGRTRQDILVKFVVTGPDFASAHADLSQFNSAYASLYSDMAASCTETGGSYECSIQGIVMNINQGTIEVLVTMTDTAGVEHSSTLTKTFNIDNSRPTVSYLGTETCYEDRCYITPNAPNKILVTLQDDVASFERRIVFFYLDTDRRIQDCDGMNCYGFIDVNCESGDRKSLTISTMGGVFSQDDAGNRVMDSPTITLYCDSEPPELINISIEPASGLQHIQSGDNIIITAFLTDDLTEVRGVANLTYVGGDPEEEKACSQEGNKWKCEWNVNNIAPGPYTEELEFKFYDTLDNVLEISEEIVVLGVEEGVTPDNWRIQSTSYTPTSINREFAEYFNIKIYDHITLSPQGSNVEILQLEISGCVAKQGNIAYMKNGKPELLNFVRGSVHPIAIAELRTAAIEEEQLEFVCTLDIYSRRGDYTYAEPEKDNFTILLDVYGDTSALMNTRVQDEIADAINTAEEFEEKWGDLYDMVTYTKILCQALPALKGLQGGLGTAALGARAVPDGGSTSNKLNDAAEKVGEGEESLQTTVGQVCQYMACKQDFKIISAESIG
ncbi:MAG: hypothetical protein ABIE94_02395, partial [archaeon]